MAKLVPNSFIVPEEYIQPEFILKKLCYDDAKLDYDAVMSSIDIIHKTRGGTWPTHDLTYEDDLIDLGWHQREFENRTSFTYTLLNPDRTKCLGCVYIYPTDIGKFQAPEGADVILSMWVTQEEYDNGLYPKLFKAVKNWIEKVWSFRNPYYSNKEIPGE